MHYRKNKLTPKICAVLAVVVLLGSLLTPSITEAFETVELINFESKTISVTRKERGGAVTTKTYAIADDVLVYKIGKIVSSDLVKSDSEVFLLKKKNSSGDFVVHKIILIPTEEEKEVIRAERGLVSKLKKQDSSNVERKSELEISTASSTDALSTMTSTTTATSTITIIASTTATTTATTTTDGSFSEDSADDKIIVPSLETENATSTALDISTASSTEQTMASTTETGGTGNTEPDSSETPKDETAAPTVTPSASTDTIPAVETIEVIVIPADTNTSTVSEAIDPPSAPAPAEVTAPVVE